MDRGVMAQMEYRAAFDWKYELASVLMVNLGYATKVVFEVRDDLYTFLNDQGYTWDGELWRTDDIVP